MTPVWLTGPPKKGKLSEKERPQPKNPPGSPGSKSLPNRVLPQVPPPRSRAFQPMPTKWWASLTSMAIIPIEDATKRSGKITTFLSTQALHPTQEYLGASDFKAWQVQGCKNDCILWFHLQQLQSLHQKITSPQCYATHLDCCLFSLQFLHLAHKISYKSPEKCGTSLPQASQTIK